MRIRIDKERVNQMEDYFFEEWARTSLGSMSTYASFSGWFGFYMLTLAREEMDKITVPFSNITIEKTDIMGTYLSKKAYEAIEFDKLREKIGKRSITLAQLMKWARKHSIPEFFVHAVPHTAHKPLATLSKIEMTMTPEEIEFETREADYAPSARYLYRQFVNPKEENYAEENYAEWGRELLAMHEGEYNFELDCIIGEEPEPYINAYHEPDDFELEDSPF